MIRPGIRRLFRLPGRDASRAEAELDEEIRLHLELRAEQLERSGMAPEEARAEALRRFGPPGDARRTLRDQARRRERRVRLRDWLGGVRQDVRYSWRRLARSPGFTVVAVLTLGLGIGANSAIFSVVNSVLLRPLPFPESERLLRVYTILNGNETSTSGPDFMDLRRQARSFEELTAYARTSRTLTGNGGDAERVLAGEVSPGFFEAFRVVPLLGRTFREGEMEPGAERVVVLSHGLWRQRFGGDPGVVGRAITLDGDAYEVVGVAPEGFDHPWERDLWIPIANSGMFADSRRAIYLTVVGRLRPGASMLEADTEVSTIAARLAAEYPENEGIGATVRSLHEVEVGESRTPLLVLLGAVGLVLLIACANVANLMLARAATREGEFAVRAALGAGKGRLVRHLLAESLLLSALGGALGLVLAYLGTGALVALRPDGIAGLEGVAVDGYVVAFTAALALVTAVLFGLAPAIRLARTNLGTSIRESGRGTVGGGNRLRSALIVGQTALAVVLLVGAGLLVRSFVRMVQVDPGFRTERALSFGLALPSSSYPEDAQVHDFFTRFLERLEAVPGVEGAATVLSPPGSGDNIVISYAVAGREPPTPDEPQSLQTRIASDGYFQLVGIPLTRGRDFTPLDRQGAPQVVIINETTARLLFAGRDPLGERIEMGWTRDGVTLGGEVVGVVGDVRQFGPTQEPVPEIYLAFAQVPNAAMSFVVRTAGEPMAVSGAVRAVLREMDPALAPGTFRTLEETVAGSVSRPRFYATLLGLFAAVALLLAGVGIFGVMSYLVAQRTREIGIRVALGADPRAVQRLVVGRGLILTAVGLAIGIPTAFALTRLLESQLFGVAAADPLTFAAAPATLLAAALIASYLPSRRASRIDPVVALRAA